MGDLSVADVLELSPITQMMLAGEEAEGRRAIWPESAPEWFDSSDWHGWPVLAVANHELHIIAIWSARKGALTRLIAAAESAGLSPVIVGPMGSAMPAILSKWGWQQRMVGSGWEEREEWRPACKAAAAKARSS